MSNGKVGSREYKVMLKASRFAGGSAAVLSAAQEFWREAAETFGPAVLHTRGDLEEIKNQRLIRFFDTSDQHLNRNAYILRERVVVDDQSREVTLKFRHPDRIIAQSRDMSADNKGKWKTKFEEDIKPPFQQLYSHSTTQPIPADQKLATIKNVLKLYPGLKRALTGFAVDEPLALVDNFTARELVIGGADLHLGKKYDVWAGCVLVIWYDHDRQGDPVVAEFSFKYGDDGEEYGNGTVRRAYDVFQLLQSELNGWLDRDSKTKTAFVYG
jgi:hypothetical protein